MQIKRESSSYLHITAKLLNITEGLQHGVHEASVAEISQTRSPVDLDDFAIVSVMIDGAIDGNGFCSFTRILRCYTNRVFSS